MQIDIDPDKPHHDYFLRNMGKPELAMSFLRAYMPGRSSLRGARLERMKSPYDRPNDIVYRIRIPHGVAAIAYIALEHDGRRDSPVLSRVLDRVLQIILEENNSRPSPLSRLPTVVPIVINQGQGPWELPVELDAGSFKLRYVLVDLPRISDEELGRRPRPS